MPATTGSILPGASEDSIPQPASGAADEGPAGPRGEGFYAGYFRDLDGNKLSVFFMG